MEKIQLIEKIAAKSPSLDMITRKHKKTLKYLQNIGVICKTRICQICHDPMEYMENDKWADKFCWYCKNCRAEVSIRNGTVFDLHDKIQLMILTRAIFYNFANGIDASMATTDLKNIYGDYSPSYTTVKTIFEHTRNSIWETLKNSWIAEKLGGEIDIVEADESVFSHETDKEAKLKKKIWGVGFVEKSSGNSRVFAVLNRDAETLNKLTLDNIILGSTIFTDSWPGYAQLKDKGYSHVAITKSKASPEEFGKTSHIEGLWGHLKRLSISIYSGAIPTENAQEFIAELILRRDCERMGLKMDEQLAQFIKT